MAHRYKKRFAVENYLDGLNEPQREAVVNTEGPTLVIAGAGSGKTRVLTYRIAHLMKEGRFPNTILSLTFTNKAAREMKERIANVVGPEQALRLWMGTFHSIFARILRTEAEALGYPSSFTIYDPTDVKSLLKSIVKDLKLNDQAYKPNEVLNRISSAKNNLVTANAYAASPQIIEVDASYGKPDIYKVYLEYEKRCQKAGAMDFDDLLLKTNILFRDFPDILEKYQRRFQYILVDEYQDTNFAQYLIIKKLAEGHHNVCVVGDDAQSIYAFRGAKIENILNFQKDYPECRVVKLEQNYRSTQNIVDAANSIIAQNKNQLPKRVFSDNELGSKIKIIRSVTDNEEGYQVAGMILDGHLRDHFAYDEFAILYRTNAQSRVMEEALRKRNIPYRIYGGLSFYQRKEIKDVLAYYRLTVNPSDDEALKRIINYPKRGIGATTVSKLEAMANEQGVSIWRIIASLSQNPAGLTAGTLNKIMGFAALMLEFQQLKDQSDAYELGKHIASKTGILHELYNGKAPEEVAKHENVQELLNGIKEFAEAEGQAGRAAGLDAYLQNVALLTDQDKNTDDDQAQVTLMTIHSSKGLEFSNVFLVGMEDELFPSKMAMQSAAELEEERRLFYVAVTRAKKNLSLSFAKTRYRWGNLVDAAPSRFIKDIDPRFLDAGDALFDGGFGSSDSAGYSALQGKKYKFGQRNADTKPATPPSSGSRQQQHRSALNNTKRLVKLNRPTGEQAEAPTGAPAAGGLQVGSTVEHERFGRGNVMAIEGTAPNTKATIAFDNAGQKQLLLKFAKLRVVG